MSKARPVTTEAEPTTSNGFTSTPVKGSCEVPEAAGLSDAAGELVPATAGASVAGRSFVGAAAPGAGGELAVAETFGGVGGGSVVPVGWADVVLVVVVDAGGGGQSPPT